MTTRYARSLARHSLSHGRTVGASSKRSVVQVQAIHVDVDPRHERPFTRPPIQPANMRSPQRRGLHCQPAIRLVRLRNCLRSNVGGQGLFVGTERSGHLNRQSRRAPKYRFKPSVSALTVATGVPLGDRPSNPQNMRSPRIGGFTSGRRFGRGSTQTVAQEVP